MNKVKFENIYIREGDLIETNFKLKYTTYICEVKSNPCFLADLSVWIGNEKVPSIGDCFKETNGYSKGFKESVIRVYKKSKDGKSFTCVWEKPNEHKTNDWWRSK